MCASDFQINMGMLKSRKRMKAGAGNVMKRADFVAALAPDPSEARDEVMIEFNEARAEEDMIEIIAEIPHALLIFPCQVVKVWKQINFTKQVSISEIHSKMYLTSIA